MDVCWTCKRPVLVCSSVITSAPLQVSSLVPCSLRPCHIKPFQPIHRQASSQPSRIKGTTVTRAAFGLVKSSVPGLADNCWEQSKQRLKYSPLTKDIEVDVCVVGAGFAGLTTAYRLAQAGEN